MPRDDVRDTARRRRRRRRQAAHRARCHRSSVAAGSPTAGASISASRPSVERRLVGRPGTAPRTRRAGAHPSRRRRPRRPAQLALRELRRAPRAPTRRRSRRPVHERQPLNRRDADAQTGERSRTGRDGEQIDVADERSRRARRASARSSRRQPLARACARRRRSRSHRATRPSSSHKRDASGARRRVQSQHTHALDLQHMSTSATPAMRQYLDAKQQHRDAILFFRMGDFYEMFYEDALVAARALELTLTSRSKDANGGGIPMCGVPFHAVDGYIARLVKKGFRVAICDQVEDPRKAKGLVKREVVRVVSPGTLTDASYLDAREPAFLMAHRAGDATRRPAIGVALLDLSDRRVHRRRVRRRRRPAGARRRARACSSRARSSCPATATTPQPATAPRWPTIAAAGAAGDAGRRAGRSTPKSARRDAARSAARRRPRRLRPRRPSGRRRRPPARSCTTCAATQKVDLAHVRVDRATGSAPTRCSSIRRRSKHLEILEGSEGGRDGSLLDELDRTVTSIGSRLLRVVAAAAAGRARADSRSSRRRRGARLPHDRARQVPRRAQGGPGSRAPGRPRGARHGRAARSRRPEAVAGGRSRASAPCSPSCRRRSSRSLVAELDDLADVRDRDRADAHRRSAGAGARRRLHARRRRPRARRAAHASAGRASRSSPRWKSASARAPASRSLKVRYNRVFGYYIEISKSNLHAVPPDYHRKQTIAGGERFITPALKEYEEKVLGADERILERELEIFEALRARGRRRSAADPGDGARAGHARRARRARRGRRGQQLHQAARPRRRRAVGRRRPPSRSSSGAPPPPASRSCRTTSR